MKILDTAPGALPTVARWTWHDRLRHKLTVVRQFVLEDKANQGLGGPPNNWQGWKIIAEEDTKNGHDIRKTYHIGFGDDAFEVWIGTKYEENGFVDDKWNFFCRAEHFRVMALWYLWRWAWGEWFGLRRRLFYWDLHRRVMQMRKWAPQEERVA